MLRPSIRVIQVKKKKKRKKKRSKDLSARTQKKQMFIKKRATQVLGIRPHGGHIKKRGGGGGGEGGGGGGGGVKEVDIEHKRALKISHQTMNN